MSDQQQTREILERTLRDADVRLSELAALEHVTPPGSYERQEIESERIELTRFRSLTDRKLRALNSPPVAPDLDRQARIDRSIAERRETALRFIAKLEREGDWRQAKVWRMSLLDIPAQVERDFA